MQAPALHEEATLKALRQQLIFMGQDVPDDVIKSFLSEGGIPSVDPSVKDSQEILQLVPSTTQHHLSPVSTIDASDFREEQPRIRQASIILHEGVVRSTPSTAGKAPSEILSEHLSSINIEGGHGSRSEWSLDLRATTIPAENPEQAGGFADASKPPSKQDCRSADAATNCVNSEAQQRMTATNGFAVASRTTTGTFNREINLVSYEAIGTAQSRRESATTVDSQILIAAAASDARAISGTDSTQIVCEAYGSAQACRSSYAAQESLTLTALTANGARATTEKDDRQLRNVLHEAVGAVQSRRSNAAAQENLKVISVPAASARDVLGTDDREINIMLGEAISFAPSRHGSAAAHMDLRVPDVLASGARLTTGTDDREINGFLSEAFDTMQACFPDCMPAVIHFCEALHRL